MQENLIPSGFLGFGWLIYFKNLLIAYGYGIAARGIDATSNVAEYLGLIEGLEALIGMGVTDQPVSVLSDANVIIHRMNGFATVGTFRDEPLHNRAVQLAQNINIDQWRWVPRHCNYEADALSRKCFQELIDDRDGMEKALLLLEKDRLEDNDNLHYLNGMQIIKRADLNQAPPASRHPLTAGFTQTPMFEPYPA
jgi:ribonuclease HI